MFMNNSLHEVLLKNEGVPSLFIATAPLVWLVYGCINVEFAAKDKKTSMILLIKKLKITKILWIMEALLVPLLVLYFLISTHFFMSVFPNFSPSRLLIFDFFTCCFTTVQEFTMIGWSLLAVQRIILYYWPKRVDLLNFSGDAISRVVRMSRIGFILRVVWEGLGYWWCPGVVMTYHLIFNLYLLLTTIFTISTGVRSTKTCAEYVVWPFVLPVLLKLIYTPSLYFLLTIYFNAFETLVIIKIIDFYATLLILVFCLCFDEPPKVIPGRSLGLKELRSTVGVLNVLPLYHPDFPHAETVPKNYGFLHERARM